MEKSHPIKLWQYNQTRNILHWTTLSLLSAFSCISIFLWIPKSQAIQVIFAWFAYLLATLLLIFVVHRLIFQYTNPWLQAYSSSWKIGAIFISFVSGVWLSFNIPIISPPTDLNPFLPALITKLIYRLSTGAVIGFSLFFACILLAKSIQLRKPYLSKYSLLTSSIKYTIPIGLVWGIYLLAFFPGMMSADSMAQWEQVLSGRFVDHHPAFHTFLLWLVTRIYLSPAVIAIAQIISLAFVAGLWFAFFERMGVRRWIIWLLALIFAFTPVNGTMVNTLWKDIPYSIAVLGITLIIAKIVFTRGAWLKSILAKILLGIIFVFVLLLRHDGVILGVGTLLLLIISYPGQWKAWLISCTLCAILYFGIRGPIYKWVGVEKTSTLSEGSLSLYALAAYAIPGTQAELSISSIDLQTSDWNCNMWTNLSPDKLVSDVNRSISPRELIGNLINRIPRILLYDARCARSLGWVIWDPNGEVRNASHVQVLVDPNPYMLQPDSKIPLLREWISNWVVRTSQDPNLNWFLWRPALFLYISVFISGVLIIRNHSVRFGLLSVPIIIQALTFTLLVSPPNFRYYYAVYLVALMSIGLLFSPPVMENADININQTNITREFSPHTFR